MSSTSYNIAYCTRGLLDVFTEPVTCLDSNQWGFSISDDNNNIYLPSFI